MLFKFISELPSPSVIWKTLSDTIITPSAGYTVHQIKFMMFIILVMHDFKEAKQMCNDFLESKGSPIFTTLIFTTVKKYLDVSDSDTKSIQEPPLDLPRFVAEQFYIPYYYLLQVCDTTTTSLWLDLFERDFMPPEEYHYIVQSSTQLTTSLTKYKMWKQNYAHSLDLNSIYMNTFTIDMSLSAIPVTVKSDVHSYLRGALYDVVDEKIIFDYSEKIIIPPFRLVQEESNEAQ